MFSKEGKKLDLPVYFGDAGSPAVLHAVGADQAACAVRGTRARLSSTSRAARGRLGQPCALQVITLDTAGANYRSVWAMHKHFPHIKTFVRAFDIENGETMLGQSVGGQRRGPSCSDTCLHILQG